jgi:hypothetical protein
MKQNIPSISEACQLLISKKMVEDVWNESNKKVRDVFSSSNEKQEENWKDVKTQRIVSIYRDFDSSRGKKLQKKTTFRQSAVN